MGMSLYFATVVMVYCFKKHLLYAKLCILVIVNNGK